MKLINSRELKKVKKKEATGKNVLESEPFLVDLFFLSKKLKVCPIPGNRSNGGERHKRAQHQLQIQLKDRSRWK